MNLLLIHFLILSYYYFYLIGLHCLTNRGIAKINSTPNLLEIRKKQNKFIQIFVE